jgi:hypothetical protein
LDLGRKYSGAIELPDLLTDLQDQTQLTRRTIARILTESNRLEDFKRNPQQFIELADEVINRTKRLAIVDGIRTNGSATSGSLSPGHEGAVHVRIHRRCRNPARRLCGRSGLLAKALHAASVGSKVRQVLDLTDMVP